MEKIIIFIETIYSKDIQFLLIALALWFSEPVANKIRDLIIVKIRKISRYFGMFFIGQLVRYKRKIKKMRWNSEEIIFQSIRAHAYFILLIGSLFFYLSMILLGPLKGIGTLPYSVQLLINCPYFILEAIWILQHIFVRDLINSREKIRITSKRRLS